MSQELSAMRHLEDQIDHLRKKLADRPDTRIKQVLQRGDGVYYATHDRSDACRSK